jgi:hypothetical protein
MFHSTHQRNRTAVVGMIAVGIAIALSSVNIVRAEHAKPDKAKKFSCNSGYACVEGRSSGSTTLGVYGSATSATGVFGTTSATNGNSGVVGSSSSGSGLGYGVYGSSMNGDGVHGVSYAGGDSGVAGINENGYGGYFESNDTTGYYEALFALAFSSQTNIFAGYNEATGGGCYIDPGANLSCTGTIKGGQAVRVRHRNSGGQHVLTYASESATATIEDVGTARMSGGVANVPIDAAFASVMDGKWYYVFLTPLGDTRGLYVSMKTASGFQVRETERGRDTLSFDYRIVAHPLDAKNDRLPLAPAMRRPRIMHPAQ